MTTALAKEFRPLILPACIAVAGAMTPAADELTGLLGSLACFGGFAVLTAMTFGLEFQQHTLALLLSQPVERRRIWRDKVLTVLLAGLGLVLVNWRFQQHLSDLPGLLLLLVWMFLLACVCASGFWIQITRSTLAGLACDIVVQFLVFGGLVLAIRRQSDLSFSLPITDALRTICLLTAVYCMGFLWLGRRSWERAFLKTGAGILLFLLLCGLSQLLASSVGVRQSDPAELFLSGAFLLATSCSAAFWTLLARTTIGGAVLGVAAQFVIGLSVLLLPAQASEPDAILWQSRFIGPLALVCVLYSVVFFWLGWRKFKGLELKGASAGFEPTSGLSQPRGWSPHWLQCRANQHRLNLVRKELRLQKPLLLLAGLFVVCWLAALAAQWLAPQRAYAHLKDVVACAYAPLVLLLAGCISLGDEKVLGLTGWHLTLPIAARTQWFFKLVVAAVSGITLGLVLPFILYLLSALARGTPLAADSASDPFVLVIISISVALFILSFWTATLLVSTVRAALSAVAALIAFSVCVALGNTCADRLELLRDILSPVVFEFVAPACRFFGVLNPGSAVSLVGLALAVALALFQSFSQFRRVQLPARVLVSRPLTLAAVFLLLGILVRAAT